MFTKFVENVNRANSTALASIKFHRFVNNTDSRSKISTSPQLFEQEMKYLHDNGFKVIRMSDLEGNAVWKKHRVYCSNDLLIQIEVMDALAAYGKQAIEVITEIINSPGIDKQVKTHALV